MKVVIYIEDDVYPLDFAIPFEMFSQVGADLALVGAHHGVVKLFSGMSIEPKTTLDDVKRADLLWVCGGFAHLVARQDTLNKLIKIAANATYTVAVGNAVNGLIEAGYIRDITASIAYRAKKKYKKSSVIASDEMIVKAGNIWTISGHGEILTATLSLIESIYGYAKMTEIGEYYGIKRFSKRVIEARELKKNGKENAKYLSDFVKPKCDLGPAVLYAYDGMRAIDYLAIDALIGQIGYRCHYIADRRGAIKTLRDGFDIVVDDAIQNHRHSELLVIPSGKIGTHAVDQYLIHWLVAVCPASHRVLTVGNAEQLIGITGLLREIDPDVLANLSLGEGKYMMPAHFIDAMRALLVIAAERGESLQRRIDKFGCFGLTGSIDFD